MRFYLLTKDGEYRLSGYITTTYRDNNIRHGWRVVKSWKSAPTKDAATSEAYMHSLTHTPDHWRSNVGKPSHAYA